ncbi:phytoene desaturase family protein [Metabacillus arenae]|uniref:NAD(P)/FAD-dependent oxidoreductase n=1 Tax=Metabacillus arenae TaxID=2771434 RepID=A0A926RYH0_9BACI|nr:FAD-dependent oxidoreductase [Metabacillus arenae]MBD1382923.1 NAD(P)/FAD-dependent oxidoreductase [Metabacillus arenae]
MEKVDVIIIGGGLAGLTASIYLAREGKKVAILEKANRIGGRSITTNKNGVLMNLGAHAIYKGGEAMSIFDELGVTLEGDIPSTKAQAIWKNQVYPLPTDFRSMFTTSLFSWGNKLNISSLMFLLGKLDLNAIPAISLKEWAEKEINDPMVRHFFYAFCRTVSYTNAPKLQLAKPVLKQMKRALKDGVFYVNGGWETIISKLRKGAENAGVVLLQNKNVIELEHTGQSQCIRCADGEIFDVPYSVAAIPPIEAVRLIKGAENTSIQAWKDQSKPITAACLDLGLRKLPNPNHQFALGLDQPLFFTNQSRAAKLSEDGTQVVSLIKYHDPTLEPSDPQIDKRQLEHTMDLLHPGWQEEVVEEQYLPRITVVYDFPHIGRSVKPGPAVPEYQGLFIAGDWASHDELLADAAVASGKRAALQLLESFKVTN